MEVLVELADRAEVGRLDHGHHLETFPPESGGGIRRGTPTLSILPERWSLE